MLSVVLSRTHKIYVVSYLALRDMCQPSRQPFYRSADASPLTARLPNKQVILNLTNIQMYLNILSISKY